MSQSYIIAKSVEGWTAQDMLTGEFVDLESIVGKLTALGAGVAEPTDAGTLQTQTRGPSRTEANGGSRAPARRP